MWFAPQFQALFPSYNTGAYQRRGRGGLSVTHVNGRVADESSGITYGSGVQAYGSGVQAYGSGVQAYASGVQTCGSGVQAFTSDSRTYASGAQTLRAGDRTYGSGSQAMTVDGRTFGSDDRASGFGVPAWAADGRAFATSVPAFALLLATSAAGCYRDAVPISPVAGDWSVMCPPATAGGSDPFPWAPTAIEIDHVRWRPSTSRRQRARDNTLFILPALRNHAHGVITSQSLASPK